MPSSGSGTGTPITPPSTTTVDFGGQRPMSILSLEEFRLQVSYHPWHFWGWSNSTIPVTSACNDVVKQYAWQATDAAGRKDLIDALLTAEDKLVSEAGLRYAIAPRFTSETLEWPRYPDRRVDRMGYMDAGGRWVGLQLSEGYIKAVGVEAFTLISAANVSRTDDDGDGLKETFTCQVNTDVSDPDEIAIYVQSGDRLDGEPVSEYWRIKPVSVKLNNGVATIKGRSWLLAKPILYEGVSTSNLDPTDDDNYIETVDVYRHYCNPAGTTTATSQGKLIWETEPWPAWANCCQDTNAADPAALAYAMARIGIRDSREGVVYVGESAYDSDNDTWYAVDWTTCRPPDRVEIRYQAGFPLRDGKIDNRMQQLATWLGAAYLNQRICACDIANREIGRLQMDLSMPQIEGIQVAVGPEDLMNPFGTRKGHVEAWRWVKNQRRVAGFTV